MFDIFVSWGLSWIEIPDSPEYVVSIDAPPWTLKLHNNAFNLQDLLNKINISSYFRKYYLSSEILINMYFQVTFALNIFWSWHIWYFYQCCCNATLKSTPLSIFNRIKYLCCFIYKLIDVNGTLFYSIEYKFNIIRN